MHIIDPNSLGLRQWQHLARVGPLSLGVSPANHRGFAAYPCSLPNQMIAMPRTARYRWL